MSWMYIQGNTLILFNHQKFFSYLVLESIIQNFFIFIEIQRISEKFFYTEFCHPSPPNLGGIYDKSPPRLGSQSVAEVPSVVGTGVDLGGLNV